MFVLGVRASPADGTFGSDVYKLYGSSNKLLRCNKEKDSLGILRAVIMVKVTREH